jgi:hypothetical protein
MSKEKALLGERCRLFVAGCWLFVAGCLLLVAGCSLLVAGCWLQLSHWKTENWAATNDEQPATTNPSHLSKK